MRKRTPKTITKTIASATVFIKLEQNLFVYAVTLVWKAFLSSKRAQITDNLMKKMLFSPHLSSVIIKEAFRQIHLGKSSIQITKGTMQTGWIRYKAKPVPNGFGNVKRGLKGHLVNIVSNSSLFTHLKINTLAPKTKKNTL